MHQRSGGRLAVAVRRSGPASLLLALVAGAGAIVVPALAANPQAADDPMDPLLREAIGFYTGMGGLVDDQRARELLLEAVADGDALSQMWLARCYSRGRMFFERDEARADEIAGGVIDEVRRLAQSNHPEAAFLMGSAHAEGYGLEVDQELSFAWYYRAANLGNALAAHNLGNALREGGGLPQDSNLAAYWYHRAAEKGDALPQFWLGEMYERGEGVEQDREQALYWYRQSASRGRADAKAALERLGGNP